MKHIKTHNEFIGEHVLVEFEIFTLCNKTCSYCYNIPNNGPRFNNDLQDILRGLKRIMEMDNKKIIIELIGGEPILHKHFEKIVDFIYDNKHEDHKLLVFTHADHDTVFFKKRLEILKKFKDKVRVSCTLHLEGINKSQFKENIKFVDENFFYSDLYVFTHNDYNKDIDFLNDIFQSINTMKICPLILDNSDTLNTSRQIVNMNTKFEKYLEKMSIQIEIDGRKIPYNKARYLMFKDHKFVYTGKQCKIRAYEVNKWGDITMCCFDTNQTPLGNIFQQTATNLLDSCIITCQQKRCNANLISFEISR